MAERKSEHLQKLRSPVLGAATFQDSRRNFLNRQVGAISDENVKKTALEVVSSISDEVLESESLVTTLNGKLEEAKSKGLTFSEIDGIYYYKDPDSEAKIKAISNLIEFARELSVRVERVSYGPRDNTPVLRTQPRKDSFMLKALASVWFKIAMGLLILAAAAMLLVALSPVAWPVVGAIGAAVVGYLGLELALGLGIGAGAIGVASMAGSFFASNKVSSSRRSREDYSSDLPAEEEVDFSFDSGSSAPL